MLRGRICILLIVLAAAVAAPAYPATVTWYTSQASWEALISGLFTIDFNSTIPTGDVRVESTTNPAFSFTSSGETVSFTNMYGTSNYSTFVGKSGASGFPADFGTGAYLEGMPNNCTTCYLRVQFSTAVTNFAADFATGSNTAGYQGKSIEIKLFDSSGNLVDTKTITTSTGSTWTFLGFISDTSISSIQIRAVASGYTDVYALLDNVETGTVSTTSDTPDLGTLFLCGAGFTLLSFASRVHKLFHR